MVALERWSALWRRVGAVSPPEPVFEKLLQAYAEPQRAYHTLEHIHACLRELDGARMLVTQPDAVEMALWLHDVVYDPRVHDNEARSAAWAEAALRPARIAPDVLAMISGLILASQHQTVPTEADAQLMVDIDLTILGQAEIDFDRYETQVRQEYAWVSEADFRAGRSRILESFLAREHIYCTPTFQARYEQSARANLKRSLHTHKP